jgi:hypothetical protein
MKERCRLPEFQLETFSLLCDLLHIVAQHLLGLKYSDYTLPFPFLQYFFSHYSIKYW